MLATVRRRLTPVHLTAAVATLAIAATALATHWPQMGGDPGRSGYQPVDETGAPVTLKYTQNESLPIRTSLLTTGGADTTAQRVVYSTPDGRVHHRGLETGTPSTATSVVQSPQYTADADVFGSSPTGGEVGIVSPVSSSPHGARGFTFQVFNEDAPAIDPTGNDVAVSIFDEADGDLVDVDDVENTTGYTVDDTPLLFQDALWFVVNPDGTGPAGAPAKLIKIAIGDPTGSLGNPTLGTRTAIEVADATRNAHPTALWLRDAAGALKPYVALGFESGASVRTYSADTAVPAPGPASPNLPGGKAYTPSVPVLPSGDTPQPGKPVETAPAIYVATSVTEPVSNRAGSQVFKLIRDPADATRLILAPGASNSSRLVLGNPAPALAVSQLATEAPEAGGFVVLTTSCDVYSMSTGNLNDIEPLLGTSAPAGCSTATTDDPPAGFRHTTAALSGNLGFVQRNNGDQLAFSLDRADVLPPSQFQEVDVPAAAAYGQPAISRRLIQFGDDLRLSVYSAGASPGRREAGVGFAVGDATVTEGSSGQPQATFTVTRTGSVGGSVQVSTADNTAQAGQDYTPVSQRLTFTRAETAKTIDVPIVADITDESDETFFVRLSSPTGGGAHSLDAEGLGLIADDDTTAAGVTTGAAGVTVGVTDVTAREGGTADFIVSLSSVPTAPVAVNYVTANGTAVAPADYVATDGTLTFAAGETAKTVAVPALADRVTEEIERFALNLSGATGASIADGSGTALIENVRPSKLRPDAFTARTTPRRDTTVPFVFVTKGKLSAPPVLSRANACRGRVVVQVKSPRKTISARRVSLKRNCTYRSRVRFIARRRFQANGRLRFVVRFMGNADVLAASARTQTVKTR